MNPGPFSHESGALTTELSPSPVFLAHTFWEGSIELFPALTGPCQGRLELFSAHTGRDGHIELFPAHTVGEGRIEVFPAHTGGEGHIELFPAHTAGGVDKRAWSRQISSNLHSDAAFLYSYFAPAVALKQKTAPG